MKKKSLIIIWLGFIVLASVITYFNMPIPFYTKYLAKTALTEHLSRKVNVRYSWHNDDYAVIDSNLMIKYNYKNKTIYDERISRREEGKANEIYTKFKQNVKTKLELPKTISLSTSLNLKKNKTKESKLYFLGIKEREHFSDEKSKERLAEITLELMKELGSDFTITSAQIIYQNLNGVYECSINGQKVLTKDSLILNTYKFSAEDVAEDYLLWRDK